MLEPGPAFRRIDIELSFAQDVVELDRVGIVGCRLEIDERLIRNERPVFDRFGHDLTRKRTARKHEHRPATGQTCRQEDDERQGSTEWPRRFGCRASALSGPHFVAGFTFQSDSPGFGRVLEDL